MRLLFRQRFFSWLDSYDIYNENEETVYTVKGQLSIGHCLTIYDANNNRIGAVQEKFLTFLPKFEIYEYDMQNNCRYIGQISKEFTFFKPRYNIDFNGWQIEGSWTEWDYSILDSNGRNIAQISKELFHTTDTYVLDIARPSDALHVLMFVLAMDAEKCSRNKKKTFHCSLKNDQRKVFFLLTQFFFICQRMAINMEEIYILRNCSNSPREYI